MYKAEIEESVYEIVRTTVRNQDIIHTSEIIVRAESNLKKDLGLDSLALAELAVRVEAKFDIDVFENSIPQTVGDIIDKLN